MPRGKGRLRLAPRTLDTSSVRASSPIEDDAPFILNPPSSLAECVPVNITWTGGTPPYSLQVNSGDSSETLGQVDSIMATHFVWDTNVPAGTLVSLELTDGLNVLEFTREPILVGAGPSDSDAECNILLPNITSIAASHTSQSIAALTPSASSVPVTTIVTLTGSQIPVPVPSSSSAGRQRTSLSGGSIAFTVVGVLLLLGIFLWWRYYVWRTRRRKDLADTEKQETAEDGNDDGPSGLWSDVDAQSTDGHSIGHSDRPAATPTSNPFENPENILYTEQLFTASPVTVSDPGDQTPTNSPLTSSPRSSPRSVNTAFPTRPLRPKIANTGTDTGTQPLSDADAARLSISTSSTLPPSYRTRRSAGSIYIPPFPPPAYTLADAPPSAFRMPSRTPRRRLAAHPSPKPRAGGTRRESPRDGDRDGGSGQGTEGTSDVVASAFSDRRNERLSGRL